MPSLWLGSTPAASSSFNAISFPTIAACVTAVYLVACQHKEEKVLLKHTQRDQYIQLKHSFLLILQSINQIVNIDNTIKFT